MENKRLENHTIVELILVKEDIEEFYGNGAFIQYV